MLNRASHFRKWLGPIGIAAVGAIAFACSGAGKQSAFDDPDGSSAEGGNPDGGTGSIDAQGSDVSFGGGDSAREVGTSDSSLFQDARPDVANADGACVAGDAGAPPFPQRCAPSTVNECDGTTDTWIQSLGINASFNNGSAGNGFDDDCDGLVDEGCACPGNGQTKDCYLVPPSQADPATHKPVGWCTENSKGSLDCAGNEFPKWSGVCRGANPPYAHDVCAPGDFNCDGLQQNSDTEDCTCKPAAVTCPTTPIVEAPYPPPNNIQLIDGSLWVDVASRSQTTGWAWTVIGGDCDNVLPHPTYAIYKAKDSTVAANRVAATRTPVKLDNTLVPPRYVPSPADKLIALQATSYGSGVAGGQVFPAFGLSGDYTVQGEFDLQGKHYVCTQKVQVRAPGIRAELCWDTVGGSGSGGGGNDIDLHFARLQYQQGQSCTTNGWEEACPLGATYQDCWYNGVSGCRDSGDPAWGYQPSANSACLGWSSRRSVGCTNPRLDRDNITCDRSVDDPTNAASFCGPENINLDNPKDGDSFVVGVNHYANHGGTANAKTHVNLYCNGERVISVGYNPVTGTNDFPVLVTPGSDASGDLWTVGTIKAHVNGGTLASCTVATIPSHVADATRDGSLAVCVDSKASGANYNYTNHQFVEHQPTQVVPNGSLPQTPAEWCKH